MKSALCLLLVLAACGGDPSVPATPPPPPAASAPSLPVNQVDVGPLDAVLAAQGEALFNTRCTTCHKMDARYVGPALGDVATRRPPAYVMNMILAPEKMLQSDPDAQALLAEYSIPMTNQNLSEDEARAILEYLRQVAGAQ